MELNWNGKIKKKLLRWKWIADWMELTSAHFFIQWFFPRCSSAHFIIGFTRIKSVPLQPCLNLLSKSEQTCCSPGSLLDISPYIHFAFLRSNVANFFLKLSEFGDLQKFFSRRGLLNLKLELE